MSDESQSPFFVPRKRAALTGTAFDFIRVEVTCSKCSKKSKHPLAELVVIDDIDCSFCGASIGLHSGGRQAELLQLAKEYQQIELM